VKGDARSEPSSSGAAFASRWRTACQRYAGPGFAGFVLLHCAIEALRARTDGAVQGAGVELEPVLVAGLSLLGLPFAVFAWHELRRPRTRAEGEKARALDLLERPTLVLVLAFVIWHVAQIAYPLSIGTFAPSDVRPELTALLSSSWYGVPLIAAGYLCGVAAASFFGSREALRALGISPRRAYARGIVTLGVLAYLLGCYAVIRDASGAILP
jgi:hypothetical protein